MRVYIVGVQCTTCNIWLGPGIGSSLTGAEPHAETGSRYPGSFFLISRAGLYLTHGWAYHFRRSRVLSILVFVCSVCRFLYRAGGGDDGESGPGSS